SSEPIERQGGVPMAVSSRRAELGAPAPAFALPDLAGEKTVRFPDDFQNQPVMLIFFSPT
ncbi:MAG: hypothetical protein QME13_02145, partial [Thermoanaerobacteraceae bacterium]|nr:hypothetical protein [Thermoanaerobacteraceae bacterium]